MGLVSELRRRNVFRVAIAYVLIAWVILEAGDLLAPALHLPEWVVSALVFFLVLGFPLALIFAWAFEMTPEGIKLEKHVDRSKSITHLTGRKLDYLIIAALALALVFFAFDKWVLGPFRDAELVQMTQEAATEQASTSADEEITSNSIAVLPFADLSPEGDQEYFSDGISEEILNALAHIPELRVISRSSSFSFKGKGLDIPTVAKQLGVANILEGSVRKSGERIRITAQLIDANTDTHLWSETYDRELKDVFAVQDEISVAIVTALKDHLGLQVDVAPHVISAANTEAHEAYLRGRHLVVKLTRTTFEGAIREYERAIALDPDYALAHAELALATLMLSRSRIRGDLTTTEAIADAAPHAERAMALDPTLAEAHAATGYVLRRLLRPEEAVAHFRQAIEINPNYAVAYGWLAAVLYQDLGQYTESFAAMEASYRLDPLSLAVANDYVEYLIERNRLAEANREIEKLTSIAPDLYMDLRGSLTSLGGRWANLVLTLLDSLQIEPESGREWHLSNRFAAIGLEKEALAILEPPRLRTLWSLGRPEDAVTAAEARLAEDPDSLLNLHYLGLALASAGDYVRARPILEEMWQRSAERVTRYGFTVDHAAALVTIHREAGEEAEVSKLISAIRDHVRRLREAGIIRSILLWDDDYEAGLVDYLWGDRPKGLALISKAAEDGFFILPKQAYLQVLYDDPGFAPIRESQEARQARERHRFLSIVCNDNPYEAVWQPAEGTCEKFAPADGW